MNGDWPFLYINPIEIMIIPLIAALNKSEIIQSELEQEAYEEAKLRQQNDNDKSYARGEWSESKVGRAYTKSATTAFVDKVQSFVYGEKKKVGRRVRAAVMLEASNLPSEKIAFLFSKALYNSMSLAHKKPLKRVTLCKRVGDLIHDELRIDTFSEGSKERKALLKKLMKQFDKRQYPRSWRKRTIQNYFEAEQMDWSAWSDKERIDIGHALLVLFKNSTGLLTVDAKGMVQADPELLEHFEKSMQKSIMQFMLYKPMVVPPVPWSDTNLFRGGYHTDKVRRYPIIKGSGRRDAKRILDMDLRQVIPAVNAIQETPWRVNKNMLKIMEWAMFKRGGNFANLPPANPIPLPPIPFNYRSNSDVNKEHNLKVFLVHNENRMLISKRLAVLSTITLARKYADFEAIYFPHNMDSRGRVYPVCAFLNPQGTDYVKGLLEFADAVPIDTPEQAAWLAIGGANAYGFDKADLQDRVKWVEDHHDMIMEIAANPYEDLRWTEAGEPFQFLRFCMEWAAFDDYGYGYPSRFVVHVDATCSGLQHYSAMLRDEVGGRSVNLVPNLPRQDIYGDVAKRVVKMMEDEIDKELLPMAENLLKFGVNRSTTKRQVMVVPYAGTFKSCMEYTREAIEEWHSEGNARLWPEEEDGAYVVYLSRLIWDSINNTVERAAVAMKWLTKAARVYSKWANESLPEGYERRMTWTTPDGFEVAHWRPEQSKERINTFLDGRVSLVYYNQGGRLSSQDMALAIAPNFIHSLDATHLRQAVVAGKRAGLRDFAVIHDSFGTHAGNVDKFLNEAIKPTFINMYRGNLLRDFAESLPLPVQLELEPVPAQGELDVEAIAQSQFIFS